MEVVLMEVIVYSCVSLKGSEEIIPPHSLMNPRLNTEPN